MRAEPSQNDSFRLRQRNLISISLLLSLLLVTADSYQASLSTLSRRMRPCASASPSHPRSSFVASTLRHKQKSFSTTSTVTTSSSTTTTTTTNRRLSMNAMPNPQEVQRTTSTALQGTAAVALSKNSLGASQWHRILRRPSTTRTHTHSPTEWNSQNMAIALPALMGLLADPVLSIVDTGFVGRIGSMNLAALGVCTSIFHMCFTVFRASTVATTSLVASAETQAEKRHIAKISLQLAGILGTAVLIGLRFGGPALLTTMGVGPTSPMYKPACEYLFARCWAAPAVVGIVVAEGAFRGNDDSKTPLVASAMAAFINLVLDPFLMFPMGMGMAGAAAATAASQLGAAAIYGRRLFQRKLLPQPEDAKVGNSAAIVKSILGANLAMLAKQGSMLVFYTMATALATRMGPMQVATHQIALSLFWLVTMWLDSGSISSQVLMGKNLTAPDKVKSLTKYMVKYSLVQGLAFSALVAGIGRYVPGVFTQDMGIQNLLLKCLPHLAFQQTLVSLTLILEGLAIGGNQFRFMAAGTTASTLAGVYQLTRATSVVGIWSSAVNTFFGLRLINAIIGVTRVHLGLRNPVAAKERQEEPIESLPVSAVTP